MTGMREEKVVGGISCSQVLAELSDYLDDDLPSAARAQVEDHLRGCEGCARFGGEFQGTVRALRAHLAIGSLPPSLRARIRKAVEEEPAGADS